MLLIVVFCSANIESTAAFGNQNPRTMFCPLVTTNLAPNQMYVYSISRLFFFIIIIIHAMRIAFVSVCISYNSEPGNFHMFSFGKGAATKPRHGNDIKGGQAQTGKASCTTTESCEALH